MPRRNGMGPENRGPLSGRGFGFCAGANCYGPPSSMAAGRGAPWRRGGHGGFCGHWGSLGFYGPARHGGRSAFEGRVAALKEELQFMNDRLAELNAHSESDEEGEV